MKYFLFIVYIIISMTAFSQRKQIQLHDNLEEYNNFKETSKIKFETICNYSNLIPRNLHLRDSLLFVVGYGVNIDYWIDIFNLQTLQSEKQCHKYGKGPSESLSATSSGFLGNKFWTFDMTKKRLVLFDDILVNDTLINIIPYEYSHFKTVLMNDSIVIGNSAFETDYVLDFINLREGKRFKGAGSLENLPKSYSTILKNQFVSSDVKVKPDQSKIAVAYYYWDLVEIYSADGELLHALKGTTGITPDYKIGAREKPTMIKLPTTKIGFVNIFTTDQYIYTSFSGKPRGTAKNGQFDGWNCNLLKVFDWNGYPVKEYTLDHPIRNFCVDPENKIIYSYSMATGELIKGNL